MTTKFDHILNWTLKDGSHNFPGPDGGTCINEAAIVAAGFPYRGVSEVEDLPDCFSRSVGQFLIGVNDMLPDEPRQLLLPLISRLSGSADTWRVERKRAALIYTRMVGKKADHDAPRVELVGRAVTFLARQVMGRLQAVQVSIPGFGVMPSIQYVCPSESELMDLGRHVVDIANAALDIGRQAPPSDLQLIEERMAAARQSQLETV